MNQSQHWYRKLKKPSWAPPASLFGPVWSVLYIIIVVSFGNVFYYTFAGNIPQIVAYYFLANLFFNILFTPLQFGLRSNLLASIDIVLVFISLISSLYFIWPFMPWVVYSNIPYVLWVTFAMILQVTITCMNWPKKKSL